MWRTEGLEPQAGPLQQKLGMFTASPQLVYQKLMIRRTQLKTTCKLLAPSPFNLLSSFVTRRAERGVVRRRCLRASSRPEWHTWQAVADEPC